MFRNLLAVLGLASAAAFSPAAVSRVAMSRVVQPAAQFALAPLAEVSMSAVTEYDKDGNPVTHYEMFDPIWMIVTISIYVLLGVVKFH